MSRSSVCSWRHQVAPVREEHLIVKRKREKEWQGEKLVGIKQSQKFPPQVCHWLYLVVVTSLVP